MSEPLDTLTGTGGIPIANGGMSHQQQEVIITKLKSNAQCVTRCSGLDLEEEWPVVGLECEELQLFVIRPSFYLIYA